MQVTFNGTTYDCTEAVKGSDFILLYDDETMIASFFQITDFSLFSISGGDWTPYAEESIIVRSATLSSGVITLTGYSEIGTGTIVKLTAPGDSEDVTEGISVDGETYPIINSMGEDLTGQANVWASGAILALLIDKDNEKAYLMNGGVSEDAVAEIAEASIQQHNEDAQAHPDIRQALDGTLKATIQVSYNGG